MGKIKFDEEKKLESEAPPATEPNPPANRAVKAGMVRIRNVSRRDIQEGDTLIKPGEDGELPVRVAQAHAHRVKWL